MSTYGKIIRKLLGSMKPRRLILVDRIWTALFEKRTLTSWGEKCSKLEFHRYKEYTTKWVTHFVEQTCSTDYNTVFRCAEEGQISGHGFDPLPRKIRCRIARKKAQILKMSTSRRRYVQIPGNSVLVSLRQKVPKWKRPHKGRSSGRKVQDSNKCTTRKSCGCIKQTTPGKLTHQTIQFIKR